MRNNYVGQFTFRLPADRLQPPRLLRGHVRQPGCHHRHPTAHVHTQRTEKTGESRWRSLRLAVKLGGALKGVAANMSNARSKLERANKKKAPRASMATKHKLRASISGLSALTKMSSKKSMGSLGDLSESETQE